MKASSASAKLAIMFAFLLLAIIVAGCSTSEERQQPEQPEELQIAQTNDSEVELKEGCDYDNPPCNATQDCVNNSCVLKSGCSHDNPPCTVNYDCINNSCMLKQGCKYNNPSCGSNSSCINNSCTPIGCKYNNPPCNSSQICQNNKCFEHILSSGGGGY